MSSPDTSATAVKAAVAPASVSRRKMHISPYVALFPAFAIVLLAYVVTVVWNIWISFTDSKVLPVNIFVGTKQYERLFSTARWLLSL